MNNNNNEIWESVEMRLDKIMYSDYVTRKLKRMSREELERLIEWIDAARVELRTIQED